MSAGKYRELTVNTVLFAVSSFGARLVSFFLLPLYTSVLSTADYGTVDLMTSTVSLLVPVLTVNVQDAVLRFTLGKEADADRILAVGLRTVAAGACVLLAAEAALVFSDSHQSIISTSLSFSCRFVDLSEQRSHDVR